MPPLDSIASIVRGVGNVQLGLIPEAVRLLVALLDLSRTYRDDLQQLDAGLALYGAV